MPTSSSRTSTSYGTGTLPTSTKKNTKEKSDFINKYPITFGIFFLTLFGGLILFFALSGKHIINSHLSKSSSLKSKKLEQEGSQNYQEVLNDDGYTEAALSDLHLTLPGIEDMETLGFKSFSGYLTITDIDGIEKDMFYWFVESQNDPDNDPLLLWTNGGPGCSGMVGMLTEHGPFWTDPDSSIYVNDDAWNNIANIFYVEQPYGVGYSEAVNSEATSGDENAAYQIYQMVIAFVEMFPKYSTNDFYLSAESWGGHYMPWSARQILEGNDEGTNTYINFKGFIVGNPYTNDEENNIGWMRSLYGHGLLTNELWEEYNTNCITEDEIEDSYYCYYLYVESIELAGNIDYYGLDYPECVTDDDSLISDNSNNLLKTGDSLSPKKLYSKPMSFKQRFITKLMELKLKKAIKSDKLTDLQKDSLQYRLDNIDTYYRNKRRNEKTNFINNKKRNLQYEDNAEDEPYWECATDYAYAYLNRADVQVALHVIDSVDDDTISWSECSDEVYDNWPEIEWYTHMEYIYAELVEKYDITITIVSGDDDSVCGTEGTLWWLANMGWTPDADFYHYIWTDDEDQVGGYYTRYLKDDLVTTAVHFITVRSAGHMIPTYKPSRSLQVFEWFLNGFEELEEDAGDSSE